VGIASHSLDGAPLLSLLSKSLNLALPQASAAHQAASMRPPRHKPAHLLMKQEHHEAVAPESQARRVSSSSSPLVTSPNKRSSPYMLRSRRSVLPDSMNPTETRPPLAEASQGSDHMRRSSIPIRTKSLSVAADQPSVEPVPTTRSHINSRLIGRRSLAVSSPAKKPTSVAAAVATTTGQDKENNNDKVGDLGRRRSLIPLRTH